MQRSTLGKIFGAFGLVALLSSPFTLFFTAQSASAAIAKAVLGLAMIGVFFATNYAQLGQFGSKKSTFFFGSSVLIAALVLGLLGAVNYIAAKKDKTWDLTPNKLFTLAPQTTSTLKSLREKVTAIAFIPANHPAYEQLEDIFERYHRQAPDKFDFAFKDPMKNPDLAAKYQLKQGQVTVVLTRGSGATESHTTLNVVSEEELTNALIKINSVGSQKVYFLTGHGEWALELPPNADQDATATSLEDLKKSLEQEGYTPEALNLAGQKEVPRDAALVVVAGSKSPISAPEEKALESYLEEGGRMAVFAEAQVDDGLDPLLAKYGVQVDNGMLADDRFAVSSPYVLLTNFYADHPITKLLKQLSMNVVIPTARGLSVLRQGVLSGVVDTPVVLTSPFAWEETTPNDNPQLDQGEKSGQIPMVVAATRPTSSAKDKRYDEARLVVFGDSEILINANWGHEPNRDLVMNSIDWTSNQVSRITIRPPQEDISTVDIDPDTMSRVRFAATDLFPLGLLGLGLAIWLKRRDQ